MMPSLSKDCSGFTLMELMVVLILIALTAGLMLPRMGAGWKRMEEREFLQEYVQTLRRARLQAMNSGKVVSFRIRSSERLFGLESPPEKPIPENVDIYADHLEQDPETNDFLVLFYPDGSHSSVGEMEVVFDKRNAFRISIHPLFGTVQWTSKEDSK